MTILPSPSAERNKAPIWDVLSAHVIPTLPAASSSDLRVLEVACGCGVHTLYFAEKMIRSKELKDGTNVRWFPTDPDPSSCDSVAARVAACRDDDVARAIAPAAFLTLTKDGPAEDVMEGEDGTIDLITCINMIHISDWDATLGLMSMAGKLLSPNGVLYCYGPYKVGGTAVDSNLAFDANLKSRNPSWGVRDLEEVMKVAERCGLRFEKKVEMPANNLSVVYRKI
eukprot:CAMPEP_0172491624 /NCGR_PEP_ID=MMETSP1066-20121228/22510_1 /TAXON_ID=671091 /ORGANISM="Coscinodiscus wailesii, Strain CCMP2513" /LENGTH=225 /DNA_ID=CAMNT_0013260779 /DNA_START=151 /DNA_END=828 /DNA_ORIENTATION=-